MRIYDPSRNKVIDYQYIQLIDKIVETKKKNDLWGVVELCLKLWELKKPQEYKSYIIEIKKVRDTRKNAFGSTKSHSLRYLIDFPQDVQFYLRKIYTAEELDMNKQFFREAWKRFPQLRVAEKV